ncbi:hypothetical protein [Streptomyces sp. NPDC085665]|uniref:hypothetical protein n=1 Tax=Streptomyces sp. NPDC085665 TaxID=3365735 RepID=UPI0037D01F50
MGKNSETADYKGHRLTRAAVEAAAERSTSAHSTTTMSADWYVLIGGGLYYVLDIVAEATDAPRTKDPRPARIALDELGFPIFCLAYRELLDQGNPWRTGRTAVPGDGPS